MKYSLVMLLLSGLLSCGKSEKANVMVGANAILSHLIAGCK